MSLKEKHRFEDCWRWPAPVERFVRENVEGRVLNVCAGETDVGDVKVDAEPRQDEVIQADMRNLPFEDATFDTVVSDPPWKIDYYNRFRPFFECCRVCKPNGRIIYNATWIPESEQTELEEIRVRQDSEFSDTSIISMHRRYPGQQTLPTESPQAKTEDNESESDT